ncbi:hypothetical protein FEM48_Zijuj03G0154700 [Ziziphus jujuba var. spinosa]|uniref:Receptor-like protein EIX2 n=1 Tax=Ziziphus jujuba var. spinosa TaxID=714518 RepID=A0A978VR42_ZIZJJ|nr:hypothetical protein FEM48_Zijuj03G0154700 [Ziziphus jujuba var. spinosa]
MASLDLSQTTLGGLGGGPIPEGIENMTSLVHLDLSENNFNTSSIPSWFYKLHLLAFLDLTDNALGVTVSSHITNLTSMIMLDLSGNHLEGKLPTSVGAQLCNLKEIHLQYNNWNQSISQVLDSLSGCVSSNLEVLDIAFGQIYGQLTDQIGQFNALQLLDLAHNNLSGCIPKCVSNFSFMVARDDYFVYTLNVTASSFKEDAILVMKGREFEYSGHLDLVTSIDLSGTQLQSFEASSYIWNSLCSPPLTQNCSGDDVNPTVENKTSNGDEDNDDNELSWFYLGMGMGFAIGFWGVCGCIFFNRTWRHNYFWFLDRMKDNIYVASSLKVLIVSMLVPER